MTSRERILSVINGQAADHIPLTTWCFGFEPPVHLRWKRDGQEVKYWYTKRLEHIHTLPQAWTLEDDFNRVKAWFSIGVDDILDVSVPWSMSPEVSYTDTVILPGADGEDRNYPLLVREYETPVGKLKHIVKKTPDEGGGWPVQPQIAAMLEDFNVSRGVRHLITDPGDIPRLKYFYLPPDDDQKDWFFQRMSDIRNFSSEQGIFVQAWTAFGMDAVIWLCGIENAIYMAMTDPERFGELIEIIASTDYARSELAVKTEGIDMICQRGWYSSTDFWSPEIFERYVMPHLRELTKLAHDNGKKFAYVMSTGVEILGPRIADAGVDLLYFIDPLMDKITLKRAGELFGNRITVVGGISSLSLNTNLSEIRNKVREAIEVLGPTNRFILHPVDSIFPDTPWEGVEELINAWKEFR